MKPINVEITMGHDIGVSASYYKPKEQQVLLDYLKAIDLLTINGNKLALQKQVLDLKEKTKDTENNIQARLQEKDREFQELARKQKQFELLIQSLIDSGQLKPTIHL